MFDFLKPAAETVVRHGATALASFLLASAANLPAAKAILDGAGLDAGSLTNIIVGGALGAFALGWSYLTNIKR